MCLQSGWSRRVNVMEHDDFFLQLPERQSERARDGRGNVVKTQSKGPESAESEVHPHVKCF